MSLQRKLEPTRKVKMYKTRLMEKGCEETFSPMAMLKFIRIIFSIAYYHF